ncbi:MAG: hypothetical protein ABEK00_03950 [Candidatus Nanohaloarchaea archaeon]
MGYSKNNIQQRLDNFQNLEYVSQENKDNFEDFITYLQADSNISGQRIYKYISAFKTLHKKFIPEDLNLKEAEKNDVRKIVGNIEALRRLNHISIRSMNSN